MKITTISEEVKTKIEVRIRQIEEEIGHEISESFAQELEDTNKNLGGDKQNLNGAGRREIWDILKKNSQKIKLLFLWVKETKLEIWSVIMKV